MAIILAKPTFRAPGALRLAGTDAEKIEFVGIFSRKKKSDREMLERRLRKTYLTAVYGNDLPAALPDPEAAEYARRDLASVEAIDDSQILQEVLVGWEIKDIDGNDVPYTPETCAEVFESYAGLAGAFVAAYFDELVTQQPEKNSVKPSSITSG